MFTAADARRMREENTAFQKALQESVDYTIKDIKKCIELGRDYSSISTCFFKDKNGNDRMVSRYQVLDELKELGYREYRKPVYIGGVPQIGPFVTWL